MRTSQNCLHLYWQLARGGLTFRLKKVRWVSHQKQPSLETTSARYWAVSHSWPFALSLADNIKPWGSAIFMVLCKANHCLVHCRTIFAQCMLSGPILELTL